MTIHLQIDSPNPGTIQTLCGQSERLNIWKRFNPQLEWTRKIRETTCTNCRNLYLADAVSQLLFEDTEPETPDDIDEALQDFGYDLDEINEWAASLAQKVRTLAELQAENVLDNAPKV
jgi:hypothetical protein